jgi:hypothetical protein
MRTFFRRFHFINPRSEHNVVNVFFHGLAIVLHHLAMLLRQGIVEGNLDHVVGMHGLGHLSVEDFPIHDDLDRIILLELGSGHVSNPVEVVQ